LSASVPSSVSHSSAVTRGIRVEVRARYVPERSTPAAGRWFFAYHIRISNDGDATVQLLNRHWVITDQYGRQEEVRGPGVVGQQPVLTPGESFEYTSFCPLGTALGTMHGSYEMQTRAGERFDVEIARFALTEPYAIN
jgi:ApaG protein